MKKIHAMAFKKIFIGEHNEILMQDLDGQYWSLQTDYTGMGGDYVPAVAKKIDPPEFLKG